VNRAVFLDRDGVINENRADYVKSWDEFVFLPGVLQALRWLAKTDLLIIVVSNQSAIHRGVANKDTVEEINRRMVEEIEPYGGRVDAVLYCPHRPDEGCDCRKPRPGLLLQAAACFELDLARCYLVGDALSDIAAGQSVGCQTILVLTGRGAEECIRLETLGYNNFHAVDDLVSAVEYIIENENAISEG